MNPDTDRIPVPTNGKSPHPVPAPTASTGRASTPARDDPEMTGGLSPRALAVGFGIIAWLIVIAVGRARRRRSRG